MAATMKICEGCACHVLVSETECPLCGTAFATVTSPVVRCGQVVMLGLSMVLGSTACGPGAGGAGESSESGTSTSTEPSTLSGPPLTSGSTTTGEVLTGSDTTTTTTTGPGPADSSDDLGCAFYAGCPPDVGSDFDCDTYAQDCPPGQKCMPWTHIGGTSWDATRCSPIAEQPGQEGEPCTVEGSGFSGIDDCDLGLMCWGVDPITNQGVCEDLCTGSPQAPMCSEGDVCLTGGEDGVLALCLTTCDPVVQDCPAGEGCFPALGVFACVDAPNPQTPHGEPCEQLNACEPGQACIDAASYGPGCAGNVGCCTTVCSVDDPTADTTCDGLAPGQVCVAWYEADPPAGLEHVGVCAPPP